VAATCGSGRHQHHRPPLPTAHPDTEQESRARRGQASPAGHKEGRVQDPSAQATATIDSERQELLTARRQLNEEVHGSCRAGQTTERARGAKSTERKCTVQQHDEQQ